MKVDVDIWMLDIGYFKYHWWKDGNHETICETIILLEYMLGCKQYIPRQRRSDEALHPSLQSVPRQNLYQNKNEGL